MDDRPRAQWQRLAQLATIVGPSLRSAGQDELVSSIATTARRVFKAEACSMLLLDDDEEHLVFHVVSGRSEDIRGERIPVGTGIAGWVIATGEPLAVADVGDDPRFSRDIAEVTGFVPTSIIALPLTTNGRILGVIEMLDARAGDDMELLMLFARQAALAVESGKVFDELGRHLLEAVAQSADADLADVLLQLSDSLEPTHPALGRLSACFGELTRLGQDELDAAADLVVTYVRHALLRSTSR